jgi:spore coat protein U-like protein
MTLLVYAMVTLTGRRQRFVVVFLVLAAFPATPAQLPKPGVTDTAILPVRIEIVRACTVSASDLNFGAYPSDSKTPVQGQTTISLLCGAGVTVEVSLDTGTSLGRPRRLSQESGTDRLEYDLYQDPARQIYWGDGRDAVELLATGAPQTVPIYGQIPAGQKVRDGTYSDTITITVLY